MSNISRVDELLGLLAKVRSNEDDDKDRSDNLSTRSLSLDCDINYPAMLIIHEGLTSKNMNWIHKLSNDSCKVYSYIQEKLSYSDHFEQLSKNFHSDWMIKLVEGPPMKSFLKLTFRQVLYFLLKKKKSRFFDLDIANLVRFIDELNSSYVTLCLADKLTIKAALWIPNTPNNAYILLNWALIEGVKWIVNERLTSSEFKSALFLEVLQKECMKTPVAFGDKIIKIALVNFLQNLDKHLTDRVSESGTLKYVHPGTQECEQFYVDNYAKLRTWLLKNRQNFAKLCLTVDNPADCWRNLNIRMFFHLNTRFLKNSSESICDTPSFSETLLSVDTKNWYSNLSMLTVSAKQLDDQFLLQGIATLTDIGGVICNYPPLTYTLSNLEGKYEKTYHMLKDTNQFKDQHTLIEFLDSCIQLNLLSKHQDCIEQLEQVRLKELYQSYLNSKRDEQPLEISRVEDIVNWSKRWTNLEEISSNINNDTLTVKPMSSYIDLIIPTCLNTISKATDEEVRSKLITLSERLIGQDFVAQSLFSPSYCNKNVKVYKLLLDLLKQERGSTTFLEQLVKIHSKDLQWNHLLQKNLCDLRLIEKLSGKQNIQQLDLIKFRAAKFNQKCKNFSLVNNLVSELETQAESKEIRVLSSMLLLKDDLSMSEKDKIFSKILKELESSDGFTGTVRQDLIFKIFRMVEKHDNAALESIKQKVIPLIFDDQQARIVEKDSDESFLLWKVAFKSTSFATETKTLMLFSELSNKQLENQEKFDQNLLDKTMRLDLSLLLLLCKSKVEKHLSYSLECSTRILKHIMKGRSSSENWEMFRSDGYIKDTINAWMRLKNNLLSIIFNQSDLHHTWHLSLVELVKSLVKTNPNLFLYDIIVNRLDLQDELTYLSDKTSSHHINYSARETLSSSHLLSKVTPSSTECRLDKEDRVKKFRDCDTRLALWNELFKSLHQKSGVVDETEMFLREIRKISYLCGEYLRSLTVKIPKRLNSYLEYFMKICDRKSGTIQTKQRLEDCERKLRLTCDQAIEPIRSLINYEKRIGKENLTKYDISFFQTFIKHLYELEYRLNLLAKKRPLVFCELEKLVKSITELFAVCRETIARNNVTNRQKLFMELISPTLSRLEPSLIPMPNCCDSLLVGNNNTSTVMIHKISQTVNLIVSKTSPKKLKLTGSDGISRSFLLKAHEDLRLDQLIMDLFGMVNVQLSAKRDTRNNYRLRRYSVTPVSSRSGLIQSIEAPSLCSTYRNWLHGVNGKKVTEEIFSKTCSSLCKEPFGDNCSSDTNKSSHWNCQVPQTCSISQLFYQLLWAKTKPTKHPLTQNKPSAGNILKYRAEFDSNIFEQVIEELVDRMPSDLVANQLWYKSSNAHSYYLKTQKFIHSCAAISMVGYIIGLGDRHPENILLDSNTGEVIHIDYNICFELGFNLSIPEQVPFRLTQNIIHAFGFAGLEGGFTLSCQEVLNTLKRSKSTLLHLLDPLNLKFMIGEPKQISKSAASDRLAGVSRTLSSSYQRLPTSHMNHPKSPNALLARMNLDMDMCSQESFDLNTSEGALAMGTTGVGQAASIMEDVANLNHSAPTKPHEHLAPVIIGAPANNQKDIENYLDSRLDQETTPPFDLQHNIKTPTKIAPKVALHIFGRIIDKLSGTDECLRIYQFGKTSPDKRGPRLLSCGGSESSPSSPDRATNVHEGNQSNDLILLEEAQTTEFQVNTLIIEATSIKNKAAMFEGWLPWV